MATALELALFAQQLEEVRALPQASRWQLERDDAVPLGIVVTVAPLAHDEELFNARFRWSNYFEPPSLKFLDVKTGHEMPSAWPKCPGFRAASLDACLPWTAEGQALHPEWARSHAYPKCDAPLQFALLTLQATLDNDYQGRGP